MSQFIIKIHNLINERQANMNDLIIHGLLLAGLFQAEIIQWHDLTKIKCQ